MTEKSNDMLEQTFDAFLRQAAELANADELAAANELDAQIPDTEFPRAHKAKIRSMTRRAGRKKRAAFMAKTAAAAVALVVFGLGTLTIGVDALREGLLNFMYDPGAPGTRFNFFGNGNSSAGIYELGYVPEGMEVVKDDSNEKYTHLNYEGSDGRWFAFDVEDLGGDHFIDTEDAVIEKTKINGYDAVLSIKDDTIILIWHNSYNLFTLCGNVSKEDLIKMAESIE